MKVARSSLGGRAESMAFEGMDANMDPICSFILTTSSDMRLVMFFMSSIQPRFANVCSLNSVNFDSIC